MVLDALRSYAQLASGLTEVTGQRASAVVRAVLSEVSYGRLGSVQQVQSLAEDLIAASKANRELLAGFVSQQIERNVARLGLVRREEFDRLAREFDHLRRRVAELEAAHEAARPATAPADRPAAQPTRSAAAKASASARQKAAEKRAPGRTAAEKTTAQPAATRQTETQTTGRAAQ